MKFGTLKEKLIPIGLLILAAVVVLILNRMQINKSATVKVPVLSKDFSMGMQIKEADLSLIEVGKYNLDSNIIKKKEDLIDSYASKSIKSGRYIYFEDISKQKLKSSITQQIKYNAVSVNTNIVKSVGGLPKAGDWVQVKIIKKLDSNNIDVVSYPELEAIKVITIQQQSGSDYEQDKQEKKSSMSSSTDKPALVTFDARQEQINALLEGEYGGTIHMVLLPLEKQDDSLQENTYKERIKKSKEYRKQLSKKQPQKPINRVSGGMANETRQ